MDFGLVVNKEKSHFFKQTINYLGYEISPFGYKPLEIIVPRLDKIPIPTNKIELLRFLGVVNYYRNHIPFLSEEAAILYDLQKSRNRFTWTSQHQLAFDKVKHLCQQQAIVFVY